MPAVVISPAWPIRAPGGQRLEHSNTPKVPRGRPRGAPFANVTGNAPKPQSSAHLHGLSAETQPCSATARGRWTGSCYARNAAGEPIPDALIQAMIEARQPFLRFNERQIALVAYFERDLYAMAESERTSPPCWHWPAAGERKIPVGESLRPLLAIPHLLNQESACAYHGYLLALMGWSRPALTS